MKNNPITIGDARLHDLMNQLRQCREHPKLEQIITELRDVGSPLSWEDLGRSLTLRHLGGFVIPEFITHFVGCYAATRKPKRILDGWAGIGSLLIPIVAASRPDAAIGIIPSADELRVAEAMSAGASIEWIHARLDEWTSSAAIDLIVSAPPINLPIMTLSIKEHGISLNMRDSASYTYMLQSMRFLSNDGVAIFFIPDGFFFQQGKALVRDALPQLGLHINAVIALPVGTFAPHFNIPLNIVLFSRTPMADLFVGQLNPATDQNALLKNLLERKPGQSLELGRLIPRGTFRSYAALQAVEEENRLAKRSGLKRIPLIEVVIAVNLGKQTEDGGFTNLPNCVYLPIIGTSPAVTTFANLRIKPHNYVQLVVHPEVAHAEFLAGLLNSPLGRKTREKLLSGTYIPKISKQTLTTSEVYTLPIEKQQTAMAAGRDIHELRLRLEQLERDLWNRPIDAASVRKQVAGLNQKDSFESWLEALPFPLASILWRYQAASSAEHKVSHLINAFEAFVQFLGTLMTSAFYSNAAFFKEHRIDWFDRGKENSHTLARSSFGDWVVRCQRLAKSTRQLLSDKELRSFIVDLYCTDAANVEALSNKGVYAVLETVSRLRNDWKGHTGIVGPKEHGRRLAILQEELARLRESLGGVFEEWWLIRPATSTYTAGVYRYSAEKAMGSRQIFQQVSLATTEVMDANELYVYDVVTQRPLQLLHFVRMLAAPETEEIACYFFNRLEKTGVRWVSYHFEQLSERVVPDAALMKMIDEAESEENTK